MKQAIFLLFILYSLCGMAQSDKLSELYEKHDIEKLYKKTSALTDKKTNDSYVYYYKALALFEMAQAPERYVQITKSPLDNCLQTLSKLRKNDADGIFMLQHKDTIKMMIQFAEDIAKQFADSNKQKAIRIYKLIYKVSDDDINTIALAQIYVKADDRNAAFLEISNLFSFAKPDDSIPSKLEALKDAPMFLMRNWMFKDLFALAEKYSNKFPYDTPIGNDLYLGIKASLDTMYDYKNKDLFFDYCKQAVKIYPNNPDLKPYLIKKFLSLMKRSVIEYDKITTEKTWRDTMLLRDLFKYAHLANILIPDSQLIHYQNKINAKYLITISAANQQMFKDISLDVVNSFRKQACKCRDKDFMEVDPMQWNETLAQLAQEHAKEMFAFNYTDNVDKSGLGPKERVDKSELKSTKMVTLDGAIFVGALKVEECESGGFSMKDVQNALDLKGQVRRVITKWQASKDGDCEKLMNYENNAFGLAVFGDKWTLLLAKVKELK